VRIEREKLQTGYVALARLDVDMGRKLVKVLPGVEILRIQRHRLAEALQRIAVEAALFLQIA
jgi:hypothetical protein